MSSSGRAGGQPHWLSDEEQAAWRSYRRMRALLDLQISRDLAADSGLSDPDYDVLSTLSEVDGHRWRLKDLADRMLWSESRLSHHISRMQDRGLVAREKARGDRRGTVVALTDEGFEVLAEAAPHHLESVRRHLIDLLTDEQVRALGEIADAVVDHLSPQ
jgi:DNA-binding MarR family transcriptional regulator